MLKSIWKDPVGSAVISGVILALGGAVGTYLLDLWPAIGRWFASVWARAGEPSLVSNWVVWLLTIFSIPALLMIAALVWAALRPDREAAGNHWRTYTEDDFLGLHWRWKYFPSGNLEHPIPFCPHCDYQVFPHHASAYSAIERTGFHCDSCSRNLPEFNESFDDLRSKIERLIQQKIRTGKWKAENAT
jgi:hypothetical protein